MTNTHLDVLFVCLHGAAKSVIAAEHFRRLAVERGLRIACSSAGIEPDASVPSHVVDGLSGDGFDVADVCPRPLTSALAHRATHIVSFGCDVSDFTQSPPIAVWDDVPAVSDGYAPARDAIVARVMRLVDQLASTAS